MKDIKNLFFSLKSSLLFKNTVIYTLLQMINKGIPFFLLPILTHYLSASDYGMISIYNAFLGAVSVFIGLSTSGIVSINYFKLTRSELKDSIGNIFNLLILTTFIAFCIIYIFSEFIYTKINLPITWMYVAVIVALMQVLTGINLTIWRSEQRAKPFALYEISITMLNVIISILLVVILLYGWEGRVIGTSSAAIIFGMLSIYIIYKRDYLNFNFNIYHLKDILKFGIPLIPHNLALWMRSGIDIFLITTILGLSQTGVYTVAFQLSSIISMLVFSFHNAYSPHVYQKLRNITYLEKLKIVRFTYLYFVCIILLVFLLNLIFEITLPYLVSDSFYGADEFIFNISLSFAFQGMYLMVGLFIFYVKKTHLLSYVTISTSILHVILSYILINVYGAIGATYASLTSFFVSFLLVWKLSSSVFELPWFKAEVFRIKGSKT